MGKITITGLRIVAHHGVLEQERRVGNEFEVDVTLDVPLSDVAMANDSLDDTINYAEVVDLIKRQMSTPSRLIEHAAGRIRQALTSRYGERIAGGSLTVKKLAPPIAAQLESVGYTTEW